MSEKLEIKIINTTRDADIKAIEDRYRNSQTDRSTAGSSLREAGIAAGVVGAGGIVANAATTAVGFSANGPVASSLAAGWQASMGSVAVGSSFSVIQGAAMTTVLGFVAVPALIGGGIAALGYGAYRWFNSGDTEKERPRPQ